MCQVTHDWPMAIERSSSRRLGRPSERCPSIIGGTGLFQTPPAEFDSHNRRKLLPLRYLASPIHRQTIHNAFDRCAHSIVLLPSTLWSSNTLHRQAIPHGLLKYSYECLQAGHSSASRTLSRKTFLPPTTPQIPPRWSSKSTPSTCGPVCGGASARDSPGGEEYKHTAG